MSSSNLLRLLRDALALNGERLDLVSGDVLSVRPVTDDTGSINIGDGTYDMDVKVFLGSTSEYVLFDVGNSQLTLACPLALTGDLTLTGALTVAGVTSFTDTVVTAEHGPGAIGTGVAPVTSRRTINGTIITEIKIDMTGLASVADAHDAIGKTGYCFIGKYVIADYGVVYRMELICLELPTTGDDDVNVMTNVSGTIAAEGALAEVYGVNGGVAVAGGMVINNAPALTADHFLYLTDGAGDTAGTYDAGQFIVRFYGHPVMT